MKTNKEISTGFAIVAGSLSAIAFVIYNWSTLTGHTHPSISSWMVWTFLTLLNFRSYQKVTKDWAQSILPTANFVLTVGTLICAIYTGSIQTLGVWDIRCLCIGVGAVICWCILSYAKKIAEWVFTATRTRNPAGVVQILLQISIMIGFIPTFKGVLQKPANELWLSWLLWTACYVSQFLAVKIAPEEEDKPKTWVSYLYPICMFFFHGAVFVLALL